MRTSRFFKKNSLRFLVSIGFLILILIITQGANAGNVRGVTDTSVKIGFIGDMTGPIADVVAEAMKDGKPILGVCLGLQLLFTRSSEGGSVKGLDFISGDIVKLPDTVKTPQMGWNTLKIVQAHSLLEGVKDGSYVYFVHSYYPQPTDSGVVVATTEYGVRFPSIIAEKNLFATQFHPEKSSKTGLKMLKNFVRIVRR